jgi:ketosteroid isomerase-like protein
MKILPTNFIRLIMVYCLIFTFMHEVKGRTIRPETNKLNKVDPNSEIRKCLDRMNEMLATKDLQKVMSIYDDSDDIIVVGSDSGEVFIGRERVKEFMKVIVSMPFVFSFDLDQVVINRNDKIAWVFVDGKMVHTRSDGRVSKVPYRIMAVMVKKSSEWKWKVFSGSIPRGE